MRYGILLLTLIILSGSFGFSLAKGKGFEGGFPEGSGLGKYRIGNLGKKANLIKKYNMIKGKKNLPTRKIKKYNMIKLIEGKKNLSTIKKPVKIQDLQRLDLGVYLVHILQIFKKLTVQLVQ